MSEQRTRARRRREPDDTDTGGSFGERAAETAKQAAASIRGNAWQMLDRQVENGAAYVGFAASAARSAADNLEPNAPQLAGAVSAAADRLDHYADTAAAMTAEELWDEVSDFTRRQPALVFGLAALAGFLAYRSIRSVRDTSATEQDEVLEDA